MDEETEYRILQIPEDAADGAELIVPVPPKTWYCYSDVCGRTVNEGTWLNCQYCGAARDDE